MLSSLYILHLCCSIFKVRFAAQRSFSIISTRVRFVKYFFQISQKSFSTFRPPARSPSRRWIYSLPPFPLFVNTFFEKNSYFYFVHNWNDFFNKTLPFYIYPIPQRGFCPIDSFLFPPPFTKMSGFFRASASFSFAAPKKSSRLFG